MNARLETIAGPAHAKLNLVLAVGPLRDDGYHGVMSAMQALELADQVTVQLGDEVAAGVEPAIVVDAPGLAGSGGDTLATRAARDYLRALDAHGGSAKARDIAITIDKQIPVGAGLGGGSSDAACVLVALEQLYGNALGAEIVRGIAAGIGSDVPFFLSPTRSAICSGRGEIVTPLPPLPARRVLLAWPRVEQSTAAVYAAHQVRRDQLPLSAAVAANARHGTCYNDLAGTALALCRPMRPVAAAIEQAGIIPLVAGSGATVAALIDDGFDAGALQRALDELDCWHIVTATC